MPVSDVVKCIVEKIIHIEVSKQICERCYMIRSYKFVANGYNPNDALEQLKKDKNNAELLSLMSTDEKSFTAPIRLYDSDDLFSRNDKDACTAKMITYLQKGFEEGILYVGDMGIVQTDQYKMTQTKVQSVEKLLEKKYEVYDSDNFTNLLFSSKSLKEVNEFCSSYIKAYHKYCCVKVNIIQHAESPIVYEYTTKYVKTLKYINRNTNTRVNFLNRNKRCYLFVGYLDELKSTK